MSVKEHSSHWRNNSGELDVFEAARYFSGANENPVSCEDRKRVGRMSLDMPMHPPQINTLIDQEKMKERKKYKQPSSPSTRLASFLNSLFNQKDSRKKKSKSGMKIDLVDQQERKRRSSISQFKISTLMNSSAPTCGNTPKKLYYEFNHKVVSLPKTAMQKEVSTEHEDEKRFENVGFTEREFIRKFSDDDDDGADSDSSSDLFDLPNHDMDFYPTGLPVYGSTYMNRISLDCM